MRIEPEPCAIVLDWYLPRVDGTAILREINRAPALSHIKVMVLSGSASAALRAEVAEFSALYREKPSNVDEYCEVCDAIIELCNNSKVATASAL